MMQTWGHGDASDAIDAEWCIISIIKGSGEHFSCLGRAAGNGETRQRERKGWVRT